MDDATNPNRHLHAHEHTAHCVDACIAADRPRLDLEHTDETSR